MDHLIDIESLDDETIIKILDTAQNYIDTPPDRILEGKVILNLFMEDSTRTRISFEMAAKRLGADVINFTAGTSSLKKGESQDDTFSTLAAYKPDAVILRSGEYAAPRYAKTVFQCPVINAGDSWRAHPTQALLDALTIRQAKESIQGLNIAICGDIAHSRVARSNYELLTRMDAHVRFIAPELLMPKPSEMAQAKRFTDMDEGLAEADVVMMLRIQKERMQAGEIGQDIDFFHAYGLTHDRLLKAAKDAIVMHPGPMNRNVEIADDVADDPYRSLILKQVENGVPVRMAVLAQAML